MMGLAHTLFRPFLAHRFEVNKIPVDIPNLPKAFEGFKVLQLSDLHLYKFSSPRFFQRIIDKVNQIQPDLIVITGDILHVGGHHVNKAKGFLQQLTAPYGKLACLGNHDHVDGSSSGKVRQLYQDTQTQLLVNDAIAIEKEGETLWISGVDDYKLGQPDLDKALAKVDPKESHITLAHNPLEADRLSKTNKAPHLILSGHTHGGQFQSRLLKWVREKWYGYTFKYLKGESQIGPSKLYVNKGLGSPFSLFGKTMPPLRYNAKPEIAVFTLKNKINS